MKQAVRRVVVQGDAVLCLSKQQWFVAQMNGAMVQRNDSKKSKIREATKAVVGDV